MQKAASRDREIHFKLVIYVLIDTNEPGDMVY